MRPIALRLTAFGSYPGTESVDFTRLAVHGLFVVSGPTGSGKTTLFDAMAYALYGTLPGDRPDDIRSHHAPENIDTEVELVFEAEGRRYRVRRTPKHDRPKVRGAGTVAVAATAELYEIGAAGDVGLASSKRDVDAHCALLVGLSAEQFQRVVLLPQGKCAQFLLCRSDERQSLLQQLFGTRLFERATKLAQEHVVELRQLLSERDGEAERHRRNALEGIAFVSAELVGNEHADADIDLGIDIGIDRIEDLIVHMAPLLQREQVLLDELAVRSAAAWAAYTRADTLATQWDDRAGLNEELYSLEAQRDVIDADRMRAVIARRAAPVIAADLLVTAKRAELADCELRLAHALADLASLLAPLQVDISTQTAGGVALMIAERESQVMVDTRRVDALRAGETEVLRLETQSAAAAASVDLLDQRLHAIAAESEIGSTRTSELETLVGGLDRLLHAAERTAELVVRRTEQQADEAEFRHARDNARVAQAERLAITSAFVADAAPRLAAELVIDQPCPVCGSLEHPAPATRHDTERVDRDQLDAAAERSRAADGAVQRLAVRLDEHRRALGDQADADLSALLEEHASNAAAVQVAQKAETELSRLREQQSRLQSDADEVSGQRRQLITTVAQLSGSLVAPIRDTQRLRAELGDVNADALSAQRLVLASAKACVSQLAALESEHEGHSSVLAHVEQQLAGFLAGSDFGDVAAAQAVELHADELVQIDESIARWDRRYAEVGVRLATLSKIELPETKPETESLHTAAETLGNELRAAINRQSQLDLRLDTARSSVALAQAVVVDSATSFAARQTAERVSALCSGKNPLNVALETWVLAGELERVTASANVHLARMTRGRYRLDRSDGSEDRRRRGGLDLLVFDFDTGRARVPATLSGGEQFQASLALALGLADVVSQGGSGSGKVFEALFVDEGFGSLDPQALDEAIDALHELHATGRMVGVITHVEAMKQQLPIGVEVMARADGAGSTLRQP